MPEANSEGGEDVSKPWRKFNFREWRSDEKLRRCSRDVQAIWLDLCGLIYEAEDMGRLSVIDDGVRRPYTRSELCKITGDDWRVMDRATAELVKHGVCDLEGGYLVSRRIAREEQKALQDASNGAKGGNPALKDKAVGENGVNPQKPEFQKPESEEGRGKRQPKFDFSDIDADDLDALEAGCRKWANGSLAPTAGPLVLAPVIKLLKPVSGPVCLMEDVRNGIMAGAASLHANGRQVSTLSYFEKPIIRARDERLRPNPEPENHHERTGQSQSGTTSYGSRGSRAGSGKQHAGDDLVLAAMRMRSRREEQDDFSGESGDRGIERVA